MPRDDRLQFRVGEDLMSWLDDRAARYEMPSIDLQARTELELWRVLLALEARQAGPWTVDELGCLAEAIDGRFSLLYLPLRTLEAKTADAFRLSEGALGQKWDLDEATLLEKVKSLTVAQDVAVYDALSRWHKQGLPVTAEAFDDVGLRVKDYRP